jgi:hypothetical protein
MTKTIGLTGRRISHAALSSEATALRSFGSSPKYWNSSSVMTSGSGER